MKRAVNEEKAGWRGVTKEHGCQSRRRGTTEEQQSQTAFSSLTLRAAGLLPVASVGSTVTAHWQGCSDFAALATAKIPRRSTFQNFQTGSKPRWLTPDRRK